MINSKRKLLTTLLVGGSISVLSGCGATPKESAQTPVTQYSAPKNIIMVVADGMGPAFTTAYRNYVDDENTPEVEAVVFDDILLGNASTYPAKVSGFVTDSAAAATALASGVKSYNGAIGVDVDKQPVKSVMHYAKLKGMRTGLAVTSQIVHATPAAYIAHNESRKNYNEIADDFYDVRVNGELVADVMLGGGTSFFEREDRNIIGEFIDAGYEYTDSYNRLATVPKGSNVLGLFAPVALPAMLDDSRDNRLKYLTEHAIKHLENDNGYFLLVEASQVDWAGHANDIASAMAEMQDLAYTMEYLKTYVKANPDTLVILTADHSTGGLTIGARGDYRWSPEYLHNLKASLATVAKNMAEQDSPGEYVATNFGFDVTEEELATFDSIAQQDEEARFKALKVFLDNKTNTGWTSSGHTGVDVEVFAFGAGYSAFMGQIDNTDIAKKIFNFIDKRSAATQGITSNVELMKDSEKPEGTSTSCDFKENWRCE
ncbi:alkaline phosphatase [Alteromonas sp. 1_MG-2023]|uniref:alkaline phosphatase n=1 Tax=Alteromonas sp. 1_MG-2023 TaxID=3062669 RepID=UPI0026E2A4FE|nr:alkaline phosphatase [Alteromonas sp. 1_MG-2023]MDO6566296.1 alkaline phosphatase [Alteromonas sp. 1_MG-2023]